MAHNRDLSQFANTIGYNDGSVGIGTDKPLDPPHASNTKVLSVGILTANYLYGDGSNLTNVSGGGASAINDLSDAVTYDSGVSIGLGAGALANDDGTDNYNTALGYNALNASTSGNENVAVGYGALNVSTTGYENVAVGYQAGDAITSGQRNVFLGMQAGTDLTTGHTNVAIGRQSMENGTSCYANVAVGDRSLRNATTGRENSVLGYRAGDNITTGINNIVIGNDADASSATTSNEITLGNTDNNKFRIPGIGITFGDNTTLTDGHVLTYSSSTGEIALAAASGGGSTGVNTDAQNNHYGIDQNGQSFDGTNATHNTLFGHQAGYNITTGDKNVVIGSLAGDALTSGGENVYVGYNAGSGENTQSGDVAIGAHALSENEGQYNVAVGFRAGTSNGSSSDKGVYIGYWAGPYVSGDDNISVGNFSMGGRTTTGSDNIAIGRVSGYDLGSGQSNTFVGDATGYSVIGGDYNTFIGDNAGFHFDNDASSNIAIGRRAGYNVDGNNNTIIGSMEYTGITTMNGVIAIGAGITERLRITSDGNIGIGTDNPATNFKLDVNGDLSLGEIGGTNNTFIDQKQDGHLNIINSGRQANNGRVRINKTNSISGDTTYFRDFEVYDGKDNLVLLVDGSERRIGIGTDVPARLLHLHESNSNEALITFTTPTTGATASDGFRVGMNGSEEALVWNNESGIIKFGTANTERLRIDASGRVTTPSQSAALVYKTGTTQGITADAIVNYDATSYSQGGMTINSDRNRITVPVAGKYMITACASGSCTTASAGDGWNLKILRDGSTYNHADGYPIETTGSEAGQELAYTLSMVVEAAANDYFEIEIGNVGAARANINRGYFGIYLLG